MILCIEVFTFHYFFLVDIIQIFWLREWFTNLNIVFSIVNGRHQFAYIVTILAAWHLDYCTKISISTRRVYLFEYLLSLTYGKTRDYDNWDIRVRECRGKGRVVSWIPGRHTVLRQGCTDGQTSRTAEHWVDESYR